MIGKVVEEHQAKIMGYSSYGIHANHMVSQCIILCIACETNKRKSQNMTKFSSSDDQGYKAVRREIWRWVKAMGEHTGTVDK